MTFLETLGFAYLVVATSGFTLLGAYMIYLGLRQHFKDARDGAFFRGEDEKWRKSLKESTQ